MSGGADKDSTERSQTNDTVSVSDIESFCHVPAALMVAAHRASLAVMRIMTHARFMTCGIDMQCALGLKSEPRATATSA